MAPQLPASRFLRLVYCLVLVAAVVPIGRAEAGWVGAVIGGAGLGVVPSFGPMIFIALALFRIVLVVRYRQSLDTPRTEGFSRVLRFIGLALLYLGALAALVTWIALPLLRWLVPERTDAGIEFYTELFLYLGAGLGMLGLTLFELSRLLSFERAARQSA